MSKIPLQPFATLLISWSCKTTSFLDAQNLWSSQHTTTNQTLFVSLPNLRKHEGRLLAPFTLATFDMKKQSGLQKKTPQFLSFVGVSTLDLQTYQLDGGRFATQYPNHQYKLGGGLQLRKNGSIFPSRVVNVLKHRWYIHDVLNFETTRIHTNNSNGPITFPGPITSQHWPPINMAGATPTRWIFVSQSEAEFDSPKRGPFWCDFSVKQWSRKLRKT